MQNIINKLNNYIQFDRLKSFASSELWNVNFNTALILSLNRSGFFDKKMYLNLYNDVKSNNIDPIEHYVNYGIYEDRLLPIDYSRYNHAINLKHTIKKYFFSIIITCYNQDLYIKDAIESALNQSFDFCQVIVVDDCSSDESKKIISFYKKYKSVKTIFHEKNLSACRCRKDGIMNSDGEYLIFLDGDDTLDTNLTQNLYNLCKNKDVDIINFNTKVIAKKNIKIDTIQSFSKALTPYEKKISNGKEILELCFLKKQIPVNIASKCIKSSIAKKAVPYITDDYIARANDFYLFLIISFFSNNYIGLKNLYGYNYNLGNGIDGNEFYTLDQFYTKISLCKTAEYIKKFADQVNSKILYNIYETIKNEWENFCIYAWFYNIKVEDKLNAFNHLLDFFGKVKLITMFSKYCWERLSLKLTFFSFINNNLTLIKKIRHVKTVLQYYPVLTPGGVERVIVGLCYIYHNLGYKVIVLTSDNNSQFEFQLPDFVIRLHISSGDTINDYSRHASDFINIINKFHVDFVHYHAHMSITAGWDLLLFKLHGIYTVLHSHGVFTFLLKSFYCDTSRIFETYKMSDVIITLSETNKLFWEKFNIKSYFIPNPLLINDLKISKQTKKINILFIGRFTSEKRPLDVLKSFLLIKKEIKDVNLIMVGDSGLHGNSNLLNLCKKFVSDNKLNDSVEFKGYNTNVEQFYKISTLLISTSEVEGFGLVILEALAYGIPCVMYKMPFLHLQNVNKGIVTAEMFNIEEVAQKSIKIITDNSYRKYLSKEARKVIADYKIEKIQILYRKLIDELTTYKIKNNKTEIGDKFVIETFKNALISQYKK